MPNYYFSHDAALPGMGLRESIDAILAWDVCPADSVIRRANYLAIEALKLDCLEKHFGHNWWDKTFKLAGYVRRTELEELLEAIDNLTEYGYINDAYLAEVESDLTENFVNQWAKEIGVSPEYLNEALYELGLDVTVENDFSTYIYFGVSGAERELEEAKVENLAKEKASTWNAHYAINEECLQHFPEACWYCKRAEERTA